MTNPVDKTDKIDANPDGTTECDASDLAMKKGELSDDDLENVHGGATALDQGLISGMIDASMASTVRSINQRFATAQKTLSGLKEH